MTIMGFLDDRAIATDLKAQHQKEDILKELVQLLVQADAIKERDVNKLLQILLKRESLGSTGIGQGVAIPHGKSDCVTKLVAAFGISRAGVNFDSLDGEPVHLFFLLVAPEDSAGPHLKALARISRLLKDKHFRDSLLAARDEKLVAKIIRDEDERRH
ncbi:MAG: PTS fructose transporter subunit IIA [Candidatus Omnitrophica bacterium CG11_big_fil_rev_8_21_14_0_20_63_9]|nr:MAG: PTS fructose transporter subunit IIA [Candidatus Omnitrophica bacterium CG11_big_fil_rev_8_21_14_0_20_63_9]